MSKGGVARGRSAEPAARPPQLDFDKLMTAVGQAAAEPHAQPAAAPEAAAIEGPASPQAGRGPLTPSRRQQ